MANWIECMNTLNRNVLNAAPTVWSSRNLAAVLWRLSSGAAAGRGAFFSSR